MKKILILFLLLAGVMPGFAQRSYKLGEVVVRAKRPMKEIGVTKTTFDSAMLKENIALSMADILAFNSSIFVKATAAPPFRRWRSEAPLRAIHR